jgi:hypothetical protein
MSAGVWNLLGILNHLLEAGEEDLLGFWQGRAELHSALRHLPGMDLAHSRPTLLKLTL